MITSPNFTDFSDSETQEPNDMATLVLSCNSPPAMARECDSFKWNVQIIGTDGNIEEKMVTSRDIWKLQNGRVVVHFDVESGQPIGDSGGLLGSWLGQLSNDVNLLPIDYKDWRVVSPHIKDRAWDVIQAKFRFDDPSVRKDYVLGVLGDRCRGVKGRIWKAHNKNDQTATLQNIPENVPDDQWCHLVHMRSSEKWKTMQKRNTVSQTKNNMPHLSGRKSFARKRHEIKMKTGKTPCLAEIFVATRTKPDGSFVSEEAKTRAEALAMLLTQNSSTQVTSNVPARLNDEYAQVFGPERPGRVRCIGRGPTPSKILRPPTATRSEIESSETFMEMVTKMKGLESKVTTLTAFVQTIIGSSTAEQATAWTSSFAAAFADIPNQTNSQEMKNGTNCNHDAYMK